MDIRVLKDSRHRAKEINQQSRYTFTKLDMHDRTEEANLFANLSANYDFKLEKLTKDHSDDNTETNKEVYVNLSIAKKIICSVKAEAEKVFEKVKDYDSEMCL